MARVLLIEDDDIFADIAIECLEAAGHMVSVVECGEDALDAVLASDPDVLILDQNLPGKSGIAIMEDVRRLPHAADLPILMLTAQPGNLVRARAHHGGADDFVTKPVMPEALLQHVETLLMGANLSRQVSEAALRG